MDVGHCAAFYFTFYFVFHSHKSRPRSRLHVYRCTHCLMHLLFARTLRARSSRMMWRALHAYNRIYSLSFFLMCLCFVLVHTYIYIFFYTCLEFIRISTITCIHGTAYKYFCRSFFILRSRALPRLDRV